MLLRQGCVDLRVGVSLSPWTAQRWSRRARGRQPL